jgi:hypothetical protein
VAPKGYSRPHSRHFSAFMNPLLWLIIETFFREGSRRTSGNRGKEGQQKPLPRSEKGGALNESTLLIFTEASRPRPDLAPGRGASQPHRLPWLHRAVPSATLDERHGHPQLRKVIGRTGRTVKDILHGVFTTTPTWAGRFDDGGDGPDPPLRPHPGPAWSPSQPASGRPLTSLSRTPR